MERGMEQVKAIEGVFPDVIGNTPEERIANILFILRDRDLIVY